MEIRRFFVDKSAISDGVITVSGEEFEHMTKVLRYKVGYQAYVCANDGVEILAEITAIEKNRAVLKILEKRTADRKNIRFTVFAGLLKNNKLDFVIQKCVELGVDVLIPFTSSNSAEDRFNLERGRKIALESAKQCGSAYLSEVSALTDFEGVVSSLDKFSDVVFAYEFEKKNKIKDVCFKGVDVALIVGPEGGFTPAEAEMLRACKNVNVVTLGRRILRAETAGIVATALTLDSLGELDND